ncbi:hypothetical protein ABES25_18555 [Bacillus gobiensis]
MKKKIRIASTVILVSLIAFGISTGKVTAQQSAPIQIAEKAGFG